MRQTRSMACHTAVASVALMWSRAKMPWILSTPICRSMRATRETRIVIPTEGFATFTGV